MADAKRAAKKKRSTEKGKFHRYYNRLREEASTGTETDVLEPIMSDVEAAYKGLEMKHDGYLDELDSQDEADEAVITAIDEDMTVIYAELCNARTIMAKIRAQMVKVEVKTKPDQSDDGNKMKVKRLEIPKFSGEVRNYPSFKRDYKIHVESFYGKDTFALKNCLSGEALNHVQAVDNDYDEMMKRLDFKYGRPDKMIDAVLSEVNSLKKCEEIDKKIIQIVDTIEKGYLDLKKLDLHHELGTTSMLSQFERLLPQEILYRWAL